MNRVNGINSSNNGSTVRNDDIRGGGSPSYTTSPIRHMPQPPPPPPYQRVIEIPVQHIKTSGQPPPPQPPPPPSSSYFNHPQYPQYHHTGFGTSPGGTGSGGLGGSRSLFRENSPFNNPTRFGTTADPNFASGFGAFDNSDFFDRFDKDFGNYIKLLSIFCPIVSDK